MKYKALPIIIEAVEMDKDFVVDTLEGRMIGRKGDYLVTGMEGEQYPCKKNIFERKYVPI